MLAPRLHETCGRYSIKAYRFRNSREQSRKVSVSANLPATSAAFSLIAVVTLSHAPSSLASSAATPTVPLKREIVEEMLVQRFRSRVKGMSDIELAQVTERLLSEQAPFPSELLTPLPSPPPSVSREALPLPPPQFQPPRAPEPPDLPSNSLKTILDQEEDDATAELLAALGQAATDGVTSATADSLSSVLTNNFPSLPDITTLGTQLPRIARAVGIGAGFALTVPAIASYVQRKKDKADTATEPDTNKKAEAKAPEAPAADVNISQKSSPRWFSWLGWLLADDEEVAPPAAPSSRSNSNSPAESSATPVLETSLPPPVPSTSAPPPPPPSTSGQVLWRRKEAEEEIVNKSNGSSNGSGGAVLWRRKDESSSDSSPATSPDLWRMPLETLKAGNNGIEGSEVGAEKKVGAEDMKSAGVRVEGRGMGSRVGPKVSESALDNAEPSDYSESNAP